MPDTVPIPPPGFDDLSADEKIEYVQSLWDRIAATPDQVATPNWHQDVLNDRLKEADLNPDRGETWEVVRERLRGKLRKR
jgi:putative addiction module component (TIGR02574 family)